MSGSSIKLFAKYVKALRLAKPSIAVTSCLLALNAGLGLLAFADPLLFGRVLDALVSQPGKSDDLGTYLLAWIAVGGLGIVLNFLSFKLADRLVYDVRIGLVTAFLHHVLHLSQNFHGKMPASRLTSIFQQSVEQICEFWSAVLREQLTLLFAFAIVIPCTLYINWKLSIVIVASSILFSALNFIVIFRTSKAMGGTNLASLDISHRCSDVLHNVSLIQSFNRAQAEVSFITQSMRNILAMRLPLMSWWSLAQVLTRCSSTATMIAVVILGSYLLRAGQTTIGEIVSFISISYLLVFGMRSTIGFLNSNLTKVNTLDEFLRIFTTSSDLIEKPNATELKVARGDVQFHGVGFHFDKTKPILVDVNFVIPGGAVVAVVGESGSGKSTMMGLLQRLWDPVEGYITIDGTDIRDVTIDSLRRAVAIMPQDNALLFRTVAENIQIANPALSQSDIEDLAKLVDAHGFISSNSEGYASLVGEKGQRFSGGERQRIGIARTLGKNAPILILDEATSALDPATEAKIQQALEKMIRGRTTFVIAHKISTIRNADFVLVMRNSTVAEFGTYEQLQGSGGLFSTMVRSSA